MINKILKLGSKLNKNEMRKITGGKWHCDHSMNLFCPVNYCCNGKWCEPALETPSGTSCSELQP